MLTVAFILGTRRAGSTWLNAVLGSHPGAAALGEYFRPFEDRNHTACRLCEANGLAECTELQGIESIPIDDAFTFAADRLQKNILIDCSKQMHWPERFFEQPEIDARLVHLVRHPCGYIESEQRRRPGDDPEVELEEWIEQNRNFERFVRSSGRPHFLACYDLLADFPEIYFPPLCRFLGLTYSPSALRYWEFDHHGLGGNGASSLYLRDRKVKKFVTGDDAYYDGLAQREQSADVRWRERLSPDVIRAATLSQYVRELNSRLAAGW